MSSSYIFIGVILNPYGLEGGVRFKSFAASEKSLKSYKVFYDAETLKEFRIKKIRFVKDDIFIIYLDSIITRTAAETLKNQKLYILSSQLKTVKEDEYYHHHLIGLKVLSEKDKEIGVVTKISDYGSGDLLEIKAYNHLLPLLIPFNHLFVKEIKLEHQCIIVDHEYIASFLTLNEPHNDI